MRESKGLFKPPRHEWIAKVITFESPAEARRAARKLVRMVGSRKTRRPKALAVVRALNYAANRAEASARRRNLSTRERRELKQVARIYRKAYEEAAAKYKRRFR